MRIAALSDAHGNAFATEAVLHNIAAHAPDLTVNLGDQAWGQADPVRALELQRGLGAVEVRGNNGEVLASHGTPSNPSHSLRLHFDYDTSITRRRSEAEIAERLAGFEGHCVYIVGHMHRTDIRRLGETLLVNVGPVNWPNDGDPRAAWCLLERQGGRWHATHKRVTYDWHAAARWIEQSNAPDKAEIELILRPPNIWNTP